MVYSWYMLGSKLGAHTLELLEPLKGGHKDISGKVSGLGQKLVIGALYTDT